MPATRRAWASWNYHVPAGPAAGADGEPRATLTYHMNRLQSIRSRRELFVTLNREEAIDPGAVLARLEYAHPVLDGAAVAAQSRRDELQGVRRTYFCGAYWGYGFHEDGVRSAYDACRRLAAGAEH
jgi:predicted NAD/FAD-binding protein